MNELSERFLEIIQTNYKIFKGSSKAEQMSAEDIADIAVDLAIKFARHCDNTDLSDNKLEWEDFFNNFVENEYEL